MAGLPIIADRCRRAAPQYSLVAIIMLLGSAVLGQTPGGPLLGSGGPRAPVSNLPMIAPPSSAATFPALPPEERVVDIRVEGLLTVGRDKILQKIHTRIGRPFDQVQVNQDVRDLYKMGVFVNVETWTQRVQGGVVVVYRVVERPLFKDVIIVGNDTFQTKALRKEAELKPGDAADPFAVENGRRKIEEYYRGKGYSKVRVTVLEGNKAGDSRVVYVVDEGPRQRIFWVNFVGNHFVSRARLKTVVQSHPPYFYLFGGEVDRKQIDEDVAKLTAYYRGFGFFHASIGRELEFNEKQNWLTLTFVVEEGPRYFVRNVSILGNKKFDTARLNAKLKLLGGQAFDQNQQNLDLQKLRDEYGGEGFVFAKIDADNRFLEEPGKLDIVYNVEEGSRYRVGRVNIQIKGENPHTQITTVLNRLSFAPGDVADTREFRASERRLKMAQLYKVEPQKGVEPKIIYSPPNAEVNDAEGGQRRTTYYCVPGGQVPLSSGEGYLDLNVCAEPQDPQSDGPPPAAAYAQAAYPPPTFQGQTLQRSPASTSVSFGQAYPPPPYPPQVPQTCVHFTTHYEPADAWRSSNLLRRAKVGRPAPTAATTTPPLSRPRTMLFSRSRGRTPSLRNNRRRERCTIIRPPSLPMRAPPAASYPAAPTYSAAPAYNAAPVYGVAPSSGYASSPSGVVAPPNYGAPANVVPPGYPASPGSLAGNGVGGPSGGPGIYAPRGRRQANRQSASRPTATCSTIPSPP